MHSVRTSETVNTKFESRSDEAAERNAVPLMQKLKERRSATSLPFVSRIAALTQCAQGIHGQTLSSLITMINLLSPERSLFRAPRVPGHASHAFPRISGCASHERDSHSADESRREGEEARAQGRGRRQESRDQQGMSDCRQRRITKVESASESGLRMRDSATANRPLLVSQTLTTSRVAVSSLSLSLPLFLALALSPGVS